MKPGVRHAHTSGGAALHCAAAALVIGILGVVPAAGLSNYPLSGPPPPGNDVGTVLLTPDGRRVVYEAAHDTPGVVEVYSAPADASAPPIRISGPTEVRRARLEALTPDGRHAIYYRHAPEYGAQFDVYAAPVDGGAPAVQINPPIAENEYLGRDDILLTPDGRAVVYAVRRSGESADIVGFWYRPVDGSGAPVRVTPVFPDRTSVWDYKLSPDGKRLVLTANLEGESGISLYSVQFELPGIAVRLSSPLPPAGEGADRTVVESFSFSRDGTRAFYVTRDASEGEIINSVPVDGSAEPLRLTPPLPVWARMGDVVETPDGLRVLYTSNRSPSESYGGDVFAVGTDGTALPVQITPAVSPDEFVSGFVLSADGRLMAYRLSDGRGLFWDAYVVSSDGSGAPVKVNETLGPTASVDGLWFNRDATRIVYTIRDYPQGAIRFRVYARSLEGEGAWVDLNPKVEMYSVDGPPSLVSNGWVLYRFWRGGLFSVPMDGSLPAVALNPGNWIVGRTGAPSLSADGTLVAFAAWPFAGALGRVYVRPADGSGAAVAVDRPAVPAGVVEDPVISPDGRWVVYRGNDGGLSGLFARRLEAAASPVVLAAFDDAVWGAAIITPDSRHVVFGARRAPRLNLELYTVPIDGSSAAVSFNNRLGRDDAVGNFVMTPDGSRVVYLRWEARGSQDWRLYSAPIEGTESAVQIFPLAGGSTDDRVENLSVTSSGSHALFRTGSDGAEWALASVRVDGAATPMTWRPGGGSVQSYRVTPDGRWAVLAVMLPGQRYDVEPPLYSVPVDGSRVPVYLNAWGQLPPLSPDSRWLMHSKSNSSGTRLLRTRVDGSGAAEVLDGPRSGVVRFADVTITPDGSRVVYRVVGTGTASLFSQVFDGHGSPVALRAPDDTDASVLRFALTPDGRRVLAWIASATAGQALWSSPVDGSVPSVWLAQENAPENVQFAPDSRRIVYAVGNEAVVSQRVDGSAPPLVMTPPFAPRVNSGPYERLSAIRAVQVTPDSHAVLYVADQDASSSFRLWASTPLGECVGDCTDDGAVTVDDIVIGVGIGLGTAAVDVCPAFDVDGNRSVTVDELVRAVDHALGGCG